MRTMVRQRCRAGGCPALLLLLFLVACGNGGDNGAIRASGHIEATEIRIAAKVGGRLHEAPWQEGDAVAAGQVVAVLDTVDAEHRLAQARAQVAAADARLRLLLSGSRVEDLQRAEEARAQARTELDAAARDLERLEGLAEQGSATTKARDDAGTRHQLATRALAAAQAQLDKLVAGPRREEIEVARAQREAAVATVAAVEQQISDATVVAPRDGVVTTRVAEPGEVLAPGAPICVLSDLTRPWLSVYVDEPNLARVVLGDEVAVRVDGVAESLTGAVTYISPVAEFTPKNVQTPQERAKLVFRVKIGLDNRDGLFKIGMPADAVFSATKPPPTSGGEQP